MGITGFQAIGAVTSGAAIAIVGTAVFGIAVAVGLWCLFGGVVFAVDALATKHR